MTSNNLPHGCDDGIRLHLAVPESSLLLRRRLSVQRRPQQPRPPLRLAAETMRRTPPSSSPLLCLLLLVVVLPAASPATGAADSQPQVRCSRSCVAESCNSVGIRYGKYCGVGWTGCPGEKPCDDLDACCKLHDECVEKKGLMSVKCHEKFKNCIRKVKKSGKAGFSKECPYDTAMPTMIQGMDMAILFSQLGVAQNTEL